MPPTTRSPNARPGVTGNTFLDVDVLRAEGITDLSPYGGVGDLEYDIFVDPPHKRHRA
ncbi:hypothetical protein [Nocardia sp. NPDC057272]|uniref:hypothetical protein n=1 Tax=Nocardia sp. NPDC057272 TaxID=3346079 RepID=UPI003630B7EF